MKKRVLSLLMAIAICLSMLPSAALAEIPGTGTNEVQTEQQITDEQKPDEQKPEEQNPEQQKPDEQNPDKQNPDEQNPDEQKPAKAPRKAPAAETPTGGHANHPICGKTCGHTGNEHTNIEWKPVSGLDAITEAGYYYLTQNVTIGSTWKPADGTVLCLNGYSISMTNNGPVIHVQPDVTFTLCDCNGSQNQYTHGITHGGNGRGAGVLVGQSATTEDTARTNTAVFIMYGGAIYNNYPWPASGKNAASASGVLIGGGTFNMYGGKITENKLTEDGGLGGGVFVANQGSFHMSGGEISGNHAKEGGGVFVGGSYGYHGFSDCSGGTFTMSGGKITGNSGTGGGVYVSNKGTFTVSGNVNITGNKAGDKTSNNVYLGEYNGQSNTIIVNEVLDRTASIGVSVETANRVVAKDISEENAKRFTSDNKKYSLQYDSTSQTLTLVGHDNHPICGKTCTDGNKHDVITNWRSISTEAELNAVIMGGCYYLTQDVKIKDPWSPANGVTLCLNGHSITLVGYDNSSVIKVESGTFTLCDCSGDSGKITNGYKDGGSQKYPGRGVSVSKNGTFTMYGGKITGNECGVSISSGASFTIGGTVNITGNIKNVDLAENKKITIDESLTQESHIGITIATAPTAGKLVWFATGANNPDLNYSTIFSCDNGSQYVVGKVETGKLFFGLHQHSWSYTANGATITATCTAAGCSLENRIGGSYTITAPDNLIYDGNGKAATVTGSIPGVTEPTITYKKGDTTLGSAPTDVGKYTASITLGEGENAKTASVEYSIEKASLEYTVPTGLTAKYGQTLADISLPTGWAWEDGTQSVGSVGEHTFKATYTPGDANYHAVTGIDVTVTVNKAPVTIQIAGAPTEKTYGDADFTVTAANGVTESTGNTGKWTWTSSDSNILEITSGANTATPTIKVKKASATGVTLTATYDSDTHMGTANVTIKVNPKDVTITGLSAGNKEYDRSTSATPTGTAVIDGKVGSDDVTVTAGTASFDNENVGTDKTVTFTGYSLSGADAGNYNLKAQPASVTANITAKEVTITSLTAANRSYEKDNLEVALISGTLTGVFSGDTVTIDLTNAKGTMTDANAGTGKAVTVTGVALGGADKDNYRLKEQPTGVTVSITKATAPTLKNITVSQKHTVTTGEKAIGTVMPADAGALTYAKGTESKTGSVTVTSWAVDATGKVTYTLSGGAAGNTVTLPVIIKSTNYADATVNVVITLTAKDIPNVTAKDIVVTYDGNSIPADKITGTADVAGTWEWKADTAVTDVSDSGPKSVVFKPADSVNYAEVEKTITVTINRATPTGEPKYTEIKTGGKTLADAALMLAGGTIPFDEGALEWIDEKGNKLSNETVVEANKSYTWRFTPANTNYTTLTGTIVLYPASTGIVIYTPVNDAIFLSGANQIVAPGSAATFRINKNFGEFRSVAVDGVTLDKSNYRAWSGSTYVKLTPAYMKTLSAGTHTLAVYFTGATATTTFTISAGSSNPATGASDFAGVGAAVAMAAVSLLGAAAVLRRK